MHYSLFVSLLFLFIAALVLAQIVIFHFMTLKLGMQGAGVRKTLKVTGLLFLAGIAGRAFFSVAAGDGNAAAFLGLLSVVVSLGAGPAIIAWLYRDRFVRGLLITAVLTTTGLVSALAVQTYFAQAFRIPTGAMAPALEPNDFVYAAKFAFRKSEPERGDIAVFEYPRDRNLDYVKRVMGLPGETVEIQNRVLFIDGHPVDDPWGAPVDPAVPRNRSSRLDNFGPYTIPPGEYFVLGDNRDNSADSRLWGTVPRGLLVGKVMMRYWPVSRWGKVGP